MKIVAVCSLTPHPPTTTWEGHNLFLTSVTGGQRSLFVDLQSASGHLWGHTSSLYFDLQKHSYDRAVDQPHIWVTVLFSCCLQGISIWVSFYQLKLNISSGTFQPPSSANMLLFPVSTLFKCYILFTQVSRLIISSFPIHSPNFLNSLFPQVSVSSVVKN